MDAYARCHLAFAFALRRAIKRVEIFTFNTALTRVTRLVDRADVSRSRERLAAGVPDWSGGTRIGECLAAFVATPQAAAVGRDTDGRPRAQRPGPRRHGCSSARCARSASARARSSG